MAATSGTPRGRALAAALRQARTSRQVGLRDLARRTGISHTLVSQWENGHRVPKVEDVASVLTALGEDAGERARIVDLARNVGDHDWLASGLPGMSQQMAGMLECERSAVAITDWSPLLIPGLLQTADYARRILGHGNARQEKVEAQVVFRSGRRDIFYRAAPARMKALIGESALQLRVGGVATLVNQLRYLHDVATSSEKISVRVVPNDVDWHAGAAGPFVLYEFNDSPPIVLLEHHRSSVFLYNDEDLSEYQAAAERLYNRIAMSEEDSAKLIARIVKEREQSS